ncbi:MAG: TIGR01777 family protein [Bacteroidales bacterium]|nr:TIGR01777 family protein [Bacteroidales bacterium]
MKTILITGGTGVIGRHLSRRLAEIGYRVCILSRSETKVHGFEHYFWDPFRNKIDPEGVAEADCIIHLAGANIGEKRWTKERKQELYDSRIKTGELILENVRTSGKRLSVFISASATGYYGMTTSGKIFSETDEAAPDFTGELCRHWESVADRFSETGARTVKIRSGVVLTPRGGALGRITALARVGLASALGTGKQYFPWIHVEDLCGIYIKAVEDTSLNGAFNAVSPEHITNSDLMKAVAKSLDKPFIAPNVPPFAMKLVFGEMAGMLLEGSRVSPEKIIRAGYNFRFPCIEDALKDLLG